MSTARAKGTWFFVGFALVALVIAGVLSYAADSDPDGLDSVTRSGCTEVAGELHGSCPARHATEHGLAGSPLADYTVGGNDALTGIAGVAGVLATLVLAFGLFRLLRGRAPSGEDGSRKR
ncbi:PDGLE domain-containing protein [Saccharomonospora sp. NPDC006951]